MTEQRPVRERLRELAAPLTTEETEALREFAMLDTGLTKPATLRRLLATLDTLERRVRAATAALEVAAQRFDDIVEMTETGGDIPTEATIGFNEAKRAISEARSLISGTKEPTDG